MVNSNSISNYPFGKFNGAKSIAVTESWRSDKIPEFDTSPVSSSKLHMATVLSLEAVKKCFES